MNAVVREIKTEASELVDDLRRLADKIEAGEVDAHTAFVVTSHRQAGITTTVCGERMTYSGLMGLLAYGSHHLYQQVLEG